MRSGSLRDIRGLESSIFCRAKAIIADVLGDVPRWFFESERREPSRFGDRRPPEPLFEDVGWSPGRTTSCSGDQVSHFGKYSGAPHVTVSARRYASGVMRDSPLWAESARISNDSCWAPNLVGGNVMLTVPKNAKTDRVICYEPHMNIRLQLAVGGYIRRRLRACAQVDLDDQSVNRRRARSGSRTGRLATIDLTMASDTLASELVWELLPIDWACLLDDLRSKYTRLSDGSSIRCEKFSSMGNGFTFELESLIFWALAQSQCSGRVTVMGDDLVVPSRDFEKVAYALEVSGFVLNRTKSYGTGHFRESCGGHYFRGADVTPFYIHGLPKTTLDVVLSLIHI